MTRAIIHSYGGGTQSIAMAILVITERLPRPERIVMADIRWEASETWEYHQRHVAPLLADAGLTVEVARAADLATVGLYGTKGDLLIPAYTGSGKLPTFCSTEWKTRVVRRYLRGLGYGPKRPIVQWLGMSLDEIERLKMSDVDWIKNHWPLCYDVPMTRGNCADLIRAFGLPEPPKSSCFFCPHRRNPQWRQLRDRYPADWREAIRLETTMRAADPDVYLHESRVPLGEAPIDTDDAAPLPLFGCESGMCWT